MQEANNEPLVYALKITLARAPSRFMVGCGRCDDWFHGDCVGLDLAKVREMEEEDQMYVCLKCCEEESKKVEAEAPSAAKPEAPAAAEVQDSKQPPKPRPGPSQAPPPGGGKPVKKVSAAAINCGNELFNQPPINMFSHKSYFIYVLSYFLLILMISSVASK